MKGKKFYFILIGLIVVGVASVFLFRQQQESRFMEFEGYEIREIAARVDELYNEDKSDIVENISEEELTEIDDEIAELREQDFSKRNERYLDDVELDYLIARELNAIQLDIDKLFIEEDIVDKETTVAQIDGLEQQVLDFEIKEGFVNRNMSALDNARDQRIDIEKATEHIESLFDEEDVVRTDVTREEEEEALELIKPIRNEEVKEELLGRVEVVSVTLTEMEEALALEEELEALEEEAVLEEVEELEGLEEEETEYIAPSTDGNSGSSSSTWRPSNQSESGSTNNSGSLNDSENLDDSTDSGTTDSTDDATDTESDHSNGAQDSEGEENLEGDEGPEGTGEVEESEANSSDSDNSGNEGSQDLEEQGNANEE